MARKTKTLTSTTLTFFAIGWQVWGKGADEATAVKNMNSSAGKKQTRYLIYTTPDAEAYVADMGGINFHKPFKVNAPTLVRTVDCGKK